MAQLGQKFDATEVDTTQKEFTPLPDGDYNLEVMESDVVESERGIGLKLTYRVIDGEYEDRRLWDYINIQHQNATAQEIGQRQLASLCRAVELPEIDDSEELHFRSFRAKVGMGKPSKEKDANGVPVYPAKNEIKKFYFPDEGAPPTQKGQETKPAASAPEPANDNQPAAAPQQQGKGARPWATKK